MNEAIHHLGNDSPSFHPVHTLIRAVGPPVLHHSKGRGQTNGVRLAGGVGSSVLLLCQAEILSTHYNRIITVKATLQIRSGQETLHKTQLKYPSSASGCSEVY
jgi:hypothetical protein